ncbi:MAG: CPBP family intramembrane metalloprotease [Arenimonas sp.]|uniref:CPBP family intramembrane glutamic endopeptidase n=1 Tax=Arenimonas sp. TaxID=1872635 RepID=UPI0025C0DCF8|nr:CPBP family intramembrane glutamic endopeptidase [Arenimonas sp.]MBW8366844.1 CPBP family intramembrane metalloprotease [Arenimonas sp.]
MPNRDRAKALLQSLLLPVAAVTLLTLFTIGAVMLAANDRAIVWAEGSPAQLEEMESRVLANPWFKHGRSRAADDIHPLPAECGAGAREFSFGSLGEFEGQAARDILELIAAQAGAQPCTTNLFIINELPDPARQSGAQRAASTILAASILPLGMVLFLYVALAGRLQLGTLPRSGAKLASELTWGVGAGAGVSLAVMLGYWLGVPAANPAGALSVADVGYSLAFTLMFAVPVMEEMAFRGWMIPLAERGIGSTGAAAASSVLYAAASLPADAASAVGYLLLGATCAGLYLRTRSVLACIVTNVMVSVTSFWLA